MNEIFDNYYIDSIELDLSSLDAEEAWYHLDDIDEEKANEDGDPDSAWYILSARIEEAKELLGIYY